MTARVIPMKTIHDEVDAIDHSNRPPSIAERAMLASLHIEMLGTSKRDQTLAEETADNHGAHKDMTRVSRSLFTKESFEKIRTAAGNARTYHIEQTLPWLQNGARILPSANFFQYNEAMKGFKAEWEDATDQFVTDFDRHVSDARQLLGDLFKPEEYPTKSQIKRKFAFDVGFSPLPEAQDFRIDLGDEITAGIRDDLEARLSVATEQAMRDLWERIHECVGHIAERLNAYEPAVRANKKSGTEGEKAKNPFRDSLIQNLRGLVDLLPRLNMTGDAHLAAMTERLRAELCCEDPDTLRKDDAVRNDVAKRAEQILLKVSEFLA